MPQICDNRSPICSPDSHLPRGVFENFSYSDEMVQPIDMTMQNFKKSAVLQDFVGFKYAIRIPVWGIYLIGSTRFIALGRPQGFTDVEDK